MPMGHSCITNLSCVLHLQLRFLTNPGRLPKYVNKMKMHCIAAVIATCKPKLQQIKAIGYSVYHQLDEREGSPSFSFTIHTF